MNGPSFLAYVEQVLAPTLRKADIAFMDNLRTHNRMGAGSDRSRRRSVALFACLLSRSQSQRTGVLEAEESAFLGFPLFSRHR